MLAHRAGNKAFGWDVSARERQEGGEEEKKGGRGKRKKGLMERAPTSFTVMASGALQSAELPGCGNAYCKLSFYHGDDWQLLDGFEDGITQITKADGASGTLIWNFPIEVVYRATNAFGWPQVALSVYSVDSLGRDIVKGYGAVHLPTTTGKHKLTVHLYKVR